MKKKILIKTPARLHLGFLDLKGYYGRIFGSIGVAIDKPNFIIEVEKSGSFVAEGYMNKETLSYAKKFLRKTKIKKKVKINIIKKIPAHVGLGSGTQLALGIGFAISRIFNRNLSIEKISEIMCRGGVSGAGTYAFKYGGFTIDSGKSILKNKIIPDKKIPVVLFHCNFPDNWFWIIGIPNKNMMKGISGKIEKVEMENLKKPDKELVSEIYNMVWTKMVPSLVEKNIKKFGESITELDKKTGMIFSNKKGKIYSKSATEKGVSYLLDKCNSYGAGQSSWGPCFYGLFGNSINASNVKKKLEKDFIDFDFIIVKTKNSGVKIKEEWLEH